MTDAKLAETPLNRSLTRIELQRAALSELAKWCEAHPEVDVQIGRSAFVYPATIDEAKRLLLDGADYGSVWYDPDRHEVKRDFGGLELVAMPPRASKAKSEPIALDPRDAA